MEKNFKNILTYWTVKDNNTKNNSNNNNNNNNNNNTNKQLVNKNTTATTTTTTTTTATTKNTPTIINKDDNSTTNSNTTTTTTTTNSTNSTNANSTNVNSTNVNTNSTTINDSNNISITTNVPRVNFGYENYQSIQHQQQSGTIYKSITSSMEYMLSGGGGGNENKSGETSIYSVYNNNGTKVTDSETDVSVSYGSAYGSDSIGTGSERLVGDSTTSSSNYSSTYGYKEGEGGIKTGFGYDIESSTYGATSSLFGGGGSFYGGSVSNYGSSNYGSGIDNYSSDENEQQLKQEKYLKETRGGSNITNNQGRDWNQEFQSLLRMTPSLEKFQKLTFLAMDFVNFAENYGFIIIKEMFLPNEQKTLKAIDIGGIAGGQKFICQGILFKFAYDAKVGDSYLYGGKYPSETSASKAAGNELKSLSSFFQHVLDNEFADRVNVPLMCIIDYFGYRLIAMSVMSINRQTLVYGSSDGGITVHDDDEQLNEIMEKIGKSMNLRGHLTGVNPKQTFMVGDFEVHKSNDQYYAVDFGRLLPPQSFYVDKVDKVDGSTGGSSRITGTNVCSRDIFFKMIRPELLKQSDRPLSSDSYSGWGICDPQHLEYNKDIDQLTTKLYNEIIPLAARELQAEWDKIGSNSNSADWDISVEAHKYGINHRHLGRIRQLVTSVSLRKHILNEMVARVFKNQIKDEQRVQLTGASVGSEEGCIHIIVEFLNRVIGNDRFETSKDFWTISIKSFVLEKFANGTSCSGGGLSEEELDTKFDLLSSVNLYQVLSKFQSKTGIKLSSRVKSILLKSSTDKSVRLPVLFYTDIKSVRPVVKHSNMIARSEGISLYMKAIELIYSNQVYYGRPVQQPNYSRFNSDFSEEIGLLEACNQKLCLASRSSTTDSSLYHLLGLVDFELLKIKQSHSDIVALKKSAKEKLTLSVKYNETPNNLSSLATILDVCDNYQESKVIYDKMASTFDPSLVVPLLFESASLYSPYYTKITNIKLLAVSFHQFITVIDILKSLPSDHQLVQQYLMDSYKILTVLILRTSSTPDFQSHRPLTNIVCIKNGIAFDHQDVVELTYPFIEEAFKYSVGIIDDFILESSTRDKSRVPFSILLRYSELCPSLHGKLISFLSSGTNPLKSFNPEVVKQLLQNDSSLTTLIESLGVQLDFIVLKRKYYPISNQLSLVNLHLDGLYLNDQGWSSLVSDLSIVSSRLEILKITGGRYQPTDYEQSDSFISSLDYSGINFCALKSLDIEDNEWPSILLKSILSSSKDSLVDVRLHYYDIPLECLEILGSCSIVSKLLVRNVDPKVQVNHIPCSVKEISIESVMSIESPLSELMKRCPSLVSIKLSVDDIISNDLKSLKPYPIQSLDVHSYLDYLNNNQLSTGIQLWSNSLTTLRMFANKPYSEFSVFISQLTSLTSLDIRYALDDQQVITILKSLKKLTTLKMDTNKYQLFYNDDDTGVGSGNESASYCIGSSIKHLSLSNLSAPFKNLQNIGMIYPNLESLELLYPRFINDVSFRGMIENLIYIKSLTLSCCYDLTDNSIIALCNSPIAANLTHLSVRDFPISDGSYVKIATSCPKLLKIQLFTTGFKRQDTFSYIRCKYDNLLIE